MNKPRDLWNLRKTVIGKEEREGRYSLIEKSSTQKGSARKMLGMHEGDILLKKMKRKNEEISTVTKEDLRNALANLYQHMGIQGGWKKKECIYRLYFPSWEDGKHPPGGKVHISGGRHKKYFLSTIHRLSFPRIFGLGVL